MRPRPTCARLRVLPFLFVLAGMSACATAPDAETAPAPLAPPAFSGATSTDRPADELALARWWQSFEDPLLDALVQRAIESNSDVKVARANVREARALRRVAALDLAPTVQGAGGYSDTEPSAQGPGGTQAASGVELYDAGFDATWELDLFGRVRSTVQAAQAGLESVEATRQDVLVTVIAEVARSYFELRGVQTRLDVARKNVALQARTVELTETLLAGGRSTGLDVSRSRTLLNLTRASIPPLEAQAQQSLNRLAVLTGRQPADLSEDLATPMPLPTRLPALAIGDPAGLLRRRPDIRAAERSLAGATAIGSVVAADLFPRVTFVGSIGLQSTSFPDLGSPGADAWQFGPRIQWAALDLGRVRARMQAADARADASLALYERTVLDALEETENALVDVSRQREQQDLLEESARSSAQAVQLAQRRFEAGVSDFLSLLDAQRTLLDAEDRLAVSRTRTVTAVVAVYKALGGGPDAR